MVSHVEAVDGSVQVAGKDSGDCVSTKLIDHDSSVAVLTDAPIVDLGAKQPMDKHYRSILSRSVVLLWRFVDIVRELDAIAKLSCGEGTF